MTVGKEGQVKLSTALQQLTDLQDKLPVITDHTKKRKPKDVQLNYQEIITKPQKYPKTEKTDDC